MLDAQQFAERPRLPRRAGGRVRQIAVGDFGKVIEPRVIEMRVQRIEKTRSSFAARFVSVAAHAQPRFDEWTEQPRPRRALMIGAVAFVRGAAVAAAISRVR